MDSVIDQALIQAEVEHAETRKSRKGEKPKSKPSKKRLEFDFAKQPASKQQQGPHLRFIRPSYTPSTRPLDDLEPISVSDLGLETRHVGKVLVVSAIGHARRTGPIVNAVEDTDGSLSRLAVYNSDPSLAPSDVLPRDGIFAIKEPFFELPKKDDPLIRIDHPSDLIELPPQHPLSLRLRALEAAGKQAPSALQLKDDGNAAFKGRAYREAVKAYTEGLGVCSADDIALRSIFLRNRSIVNIHLQRYETASRDACESLTSGDNLDEKTIKNNATAHFRAGRAEYQLGNFEEACLQYQQLLRLTPKDADGVRELSRTEERLREQKTGNHDFTAMSKAVSPKQNRPDHAGFLGSVEARQSSTHGNGLFATRNIRPGDLIFCEKAFAVAFENDPNVSQHLIHNLNTSSTVTGPQIALLATIVQKMLHNRSQAVKYLKCYDGGYSPKCTAEVVDNVVAVDAFQAAAIMEGNAFACPVVSSSDVARKQEVEPQLGSVGFWVTAAYINSACDGNARRSFIGDMVIARATKEIAQGEEIFWPYVAADADNSVTQDQYKKVWGFTCDCHICTLEAQTPSDQLKERQAVIAETRTFFGNNSPTDAMPEAFEKADKLFERLEKTYDQRAFDKSPRLGLVDLGLWQCRAYQSIKNPGKVTELAESVLRDLGYDLSTDSSSLRIDRKYCHLEGTAIEAAMQAAHAYRAQGQRKLAHEYEEFGRELYVTMHGEPRGFAANYGSTIKDE